MKDSLELEKSLVKISRIELQHQFDKYLHKQQIQHQRIYYLVVIVILVLIVAVVMVLLHLSRQKLRVKEALNTQQELSLELEKKNKELTMSVMTMIRKNETISEINDHLIRIDKSGIDENGQQAIAKISRELQKSTEEEFWKDFETRFIQVHGEFYGQLRSRFPGLTPNEIRLCAFLRLNLSSKEVSQLTGQQISTIEIARHRLRKKLGINNTQVNLVSFIAQL
jgi:DNA-binding CsgD family transcriptional regulator